MTKLYIGNISYEVSSEDLYQLFAEAGKVLSSRIIIDTATGKSRGFGFVEMEDNAVAQAAIDRFDKHLLLGRPLLVRLAHDDKELNRRVKEAKNRRQKELKAPFESQSEDIDRNLNSPSLNERVERMRKRIFVNRPL